MGKTEYGFAAKALQGDECGDSGITLEQKGILLCAVIDGVGHGPNAAIAAVTAKNYIEANSEAPLTEILQGVHEVLKSTQGAVACLCRIELKSGQLTMAGIGNITCRIFAGSILSGCSRARAFGATWSAPPESIRASSTMQPCCSCIQTACVSILNFLNTLTF